MTADLDLSPEAVERLAKVCCETGSNYMTASQAPAVMRALAAENARLRAERDEQRDRAEEAESEITRAQEQVSAEFEGDCWKAMRNLLDRTGFDWSEYSEDGVTASDAQEWIVEELDRLEADRGAAWKAGAEAMREAAASVASNACLVPPDGGNPTEEERLVCEEAWRRIRALPLPGQPKEGG